MSNSISNSIPFVPENTTDPASGLNLAIDKIDVLLQLAVLGVETAPPSGPVDGDRYIVGDSATGDWSGEDGKIARYVATGDFWDFHEARFAFNMTDGLLYINSIGFGWMPLQSFPVIDESGTALTLSEQHIGKWLYASNVSGLTLTIPEDDSSLTWPDSVEIKGSGTPVTVAGETSAVVIEYAAGLTNITLDGGSFSLKRIAANTWSLSGDLST